MASSRLPLISPVHEGIGDDKRRGNVEDLMPESAPGVEDGSVEGTGQRALSVGGQGV